MTEPKNIHEAIVLVMKEIGYVQKKKTGTLKYSYAGEAALIAALRPAMIENNITMQSVYPIVEFGEFITTHDKRMHSAQVHGEFTFTHAPTETNITVQAIGEGMDTGDKAIYKAMTGAFKYALRQAFIIETGDDPDKERPEENGDDEDKKKLPAGTGKPRLENQWETEVIEAAMDLNLANHEKHVRHRLNNSTFLEEVPYGDLTVEDGIAYLMAWEYSLEKYPDDETEQRAARVNDAWIKFVGKAIELLGGDQS